MATLEQPDATVGLASFSHIPFEFVVVSPRILSNSSLIRTEFGVSSFNLGWLCRVSPCKKRGLRSYSADLIQYVCDWCSPRQECIDCLCGYTLRPSEGESGQSQVHQFGS